MYLGFCGASGENRCTQHGVCNKIKTTLLSNTTVVTVNASWTHVASIYSTVVEKHKSFEDASLDAAGRQ